MYLAQVFCQTVFPNLIKYRIGIVLRWQIHFNIEEPPVAECVAEGVFLVSIQTVEDMVGVGISVALAVGVA